MAQTRFLVTSMLKMKEFRGPWPFPAEDSLRLWRYATGGAFKHKHLQNSEHRPTGNCGLAVLRLFVSPSTLRQCHVTFDLITVLSHYQMLDERAKVAILLCSYDYYYFFDADNLITSSGIAFDKCRKMSGRK